MKADDKRDLLAEVTLLKALRTILQRVGSHSPHKSAGHYLSLHVQTAYTLPPRGVEELCDTAHIVTNWMKARPFLNSLSRKTALWWAKLTYRAFVAKARADVTELLNSLRAEVMRHVGVTPPMPEVLVQGGGQGKARRLTIHVELPLSGEMGDTSRESQEDVGAPLLAPMWYVIRRCHGR